MNYKDCKIKQVNITRRKRLPQALMAVDIAHLFVSRGFDDANTNSLTGCRTDDANIHT